MSLSAISAAGPGARRARVNEFPLPGMDPPSSRPNAALLLAAAPARPAWSNFLRYCRNEFMAPSLGAGRSSRCQNLAHLAAGLPSQRGGRYAESPPEGRREVAVAGEAEVEADRGEIARGIEHRIERRRHARPQKGAMQRHARELTED